MKHNSHEHTDLVRRLEQSQFIFAQPPKLITDAVKGESISVLDKILLRAYKIDSDGKLMTALDNAKFYIQGSTRLLYAGYFVLGFVGVMGLMTTQVVNFFYVVAALLGWHTLSLLWWVVGLFGQRVSFFGTVFERLTLHKPLLFKLIGADDNPAMQHAFQLQFDIHRPTLKWYLGKVLHGAWLCSLIGTVAALLCLFLFRRYDFAWESTLLTDAHFDKIMTTFGTLPTLLGFELPHAQMPTGEQNARFAWLIMLIIGLYGIAPRFIAYLLCVIKARREFRIDQKLPYYANLISQFAPTIIDKDDFTPQTTITAPTLDTTDKSFIVAVLERPSDIDFDKPTNTTHEFGVIDDKASIDELITTANNANALIYLAIDAHILPDRGVMRQVLGLVNTGLVVKLINQDHAANDHTAAWHAKLAEHGIMLADNLPT